MKKDESIWKIRLKSGDNVSVNISEKYVEDGLKSISEIVETIANSCVNSAFDRYSDETVKKIFQEMDNKNEFYNNTVPDEINTIVEGNERIANMSSDIYKLLNKYYQTRRNPQITKDKIMPLMKETIENIGFNFKELSPNFLEKKMPKNIGGQNFAIRIPREFRIIVMPDLPLYERMHELGHGLQYFYTAVKYPILKGYEWCLGNESGAYTEGMAETIAKFIVTREWQKRYLQISEEDLKKLRETINKYVPFYLRFLLCSSLYEIELYRSPDQNKKELANRLYKKYLLLDKPFERARKTANIVYVSYPLYTQNYLIADIIAWQIHETLVEKFGKHYPFNKDIAIFLRRNFYNDGFIYPWKTRLKIATGKKLDIKGYLKSMGLTSEKKFRE